VILTFARRLGGDLLVYPQDRRQFELPQMMAEQYPWRRRFSAEADVVMPPPSKRASDSRRAMSS